MTLIAEFFSDLYSLSDRGVLAERDVMEAWAAHCDGWWVLLGPAVVRNRDEERSQMLYLGFEELATLSRRKATSWGMPAAGTDAAARAALIEKAFRRAQTDPDPIDEPPVASGHPGRGPTPFLAQIGRAIARLSR